MAHQSPDKHNLLFPVHGLWYVHRMIHDGREKKSIQEASARLARGEVVAFATETVYGLGARIDNEDALKKIFEVKGRPPTDPLIVHINDENQLSDLVSEIPASAESLIAEFWPGPLTLIFKKKAVVSDVITSGLQTVAVRMPSHPVARALLEMTSVPIAAPSANRFQSISPTSAKAVAVELGDSVFILDGGDSDVGLESTVVSVVDEPTVLRLGAITLEQLMENLGDIPKMRISSVTEGVTQISPGLLEFHYAPKTRLKVIERAEGLGDVKDIEKLGSYVLVFSNREREVAIKKGFGRIKVLSANGNLEEAAKNFYAYLREVDVAKPQQILAVKVPEKGLGKAINDRLKKAAH